MRVCKRVLYSGRVQGVGFRYTTLGIARNYDVAGTVRNCSDGKVELVAQGTQDEVMAFLKAIEERMIGHVAEQDIQDTSPIDMTGFQIIG